MVYNLLVIYIKKLLDQNQPSCNYCSDVLLKSFIEGVC